MQKRDFKRDSEDLAKFERYQAEALIYRQLPVAGLIGIVCYTEVLKQNIEQQVRERRLNLQVRALPDWYF